MRREHTSSSIMPDVPFAEDLVFYAPLTEGDLTDHVSGETLIYPSGSVNWDSTEQMYLFNKGLKSDEIYFPVNIYNAGVIQQPYTIFADCKAETYAYYNYPPYVVIGGYSDTTSWRPSLACSNNESSTTRGLRKKRLEVFQNVNPYRSRYYIDETGVYNFCTESTSSSIQDPANWTSVMKSRVALNPTRDGNDIGYRVYLKDIRIYNRAFTTSEITLL